ncbi:unnamed protein product [Camellia sinensis]
MAQLSSIQDALDGMKNWAREQRHDGVCRVSWVGECRATKVNTNFMLTTHIAQPPPNQYPSTKSKILPKSRASLPMPFFV